MARTPALRPYEAQSAPRAPGANYLRPVDLTGGESSIAQSLARAGQQVTNLADTMTDIQVIEHQRRQEDARFTVAQTMAQIRRDANQARREIFENAPNGWQGATDTAAQRYREIVQPHLANEALTDEARELLNFQINEYEPEYLDHVAEGEQTARSQWQADTISETIRENSNTLAADPTQYEGMRADMLEATAGIRDPNLRRDAEARGEAELAYAAVGGYVERDPHGALRALRDPNATGPFARLDGQQRNMFENRAQAEIHRRESEARAAQAQAVASLRDTYNAQVQLLERGIIPSTPLDPSAIATLLGPDVAQNYIAHLAGASFATQMSTLPSAQVAQVAAGNVSDQNSDLGNLLTVEGRNAATQVLTQRREDPGGYALRNGLMRHGDLMSQIGQARGEEAWQAVGRMLQERGADAVELRRRGIVARVAPLSTSEAQAMGAWLAQLPAQSRLAFFSQAARTMNRDAYVAMMAQIQPDGGAVNAYAGARFADNPTLSRRLVRGAEILQGGPPASGDNTGANRRPLIDMPSDTWLQEQFERHVGDAYRGIPNARAQAYETFRADYAARSEEAGDTAASQDMARARAAVGDAVGGVTTWSGRQTLMPAGMNRDQFAQGVARGFQQWQFLRSANPNDYDLTAIGGGRYLVEGVRNPVTGRPVEIQVRRPQ